MINFDRLIYGRLMEGGDGGGSPSPTISKIDQSQIAGNGIYEWRPVIGLYGKASGKKAFCIYYGKLYRALVDVINDTQVPANNPYWEEINGDTAGGGSTGATNFTDLNDTPSSYEYSEGSVLVVNDTGNGITFEDRDSVGPSFFTDLLDAPDDISTNGKFLQTQNNNLVLVDPPSGGSSNFVGLSDTPNGYTGSAGKVVSVNNAENGLEFVNVDTDLSNKSFTQLSDTPNDISTDGKILITNNNQLALSDLPQNCGMVINNKTYLKNGSEFTINDIQQFINNAVKDLFAERPPFGYTSIKCIDPRVDVYPINKGLIEKVTTINDPNNIYSLGMNSFTNDIEVYTDSSVFDGQGNKIIDFKDTNDNFVDVNSAVCPTYKRIMLNNKKIYNKDSTGKYVDTGVTLPNKDLNELSYCGKYVLSFSHNDNYFYIQEFDETSGDSVISHQFEIQNRTGKQSATIAFTSNIINDFIIMMKVSGSNTRLRAIRVRVDLTNFTHTEEVLFEKDMPFNIYPYASEINKYSTSLDKSIIVTSDGNKLAFLIKDNNNNYRVVRTEKNASGSVAFSANNYFSVVTGSKTVDVYKFNSAPSLLCTNQRIEVVVTTYNKQPSKVAVISGTKYALVKSDGIYIWDITADTETKIVDDNGVVDINACATNIIYTYGTDGKSWAIVDLDGNQVKSGTVSLGNPSIDIVQTTDGYNYIVVDYIDGDTNPFKYVIKKQDDTTVMSQDSSDNFTVAIKNENIVIGVRSDIVNNSNTTLIVAKIDSNGLTTGSAYYDNKVYAPNNVDVAGDNVLVNAHNGNNEYTNIILCIEDLTNVTKCGEFANRKGCSCLYDSVLNNVVSIDENNNIIVLDYDR